MVYESGDQQDLSSTEDPGKNGHEIQHEFMSMVNWLPTATVAEFALDSLHKPSTSVSAEKAIIDDADLYFLVDSGDCCKRLCLVAAPGQRAWQNGCCPVDGETTAKGIDRSLVPSLSC